MNKKSLIISVCLLLCVAFAVTGSANGAEPGSSSDPLVSRSYVDQRINEVLNVLGQNPPTESSETGTPLDSLPASSYEDLLLQIDFLINERMKDIDVSATQPSTTPSNEDVTNLMSYIPVEVLAGQTIFGHEGTEIILRRGKGTAVTSTDGIVDVTSGKELYNGNSVTINHLLIIPRTDGRGVKVSQSAWFIVKGSYDIE